MRNKTDSVLHNQQMSAPEKRWGGNRVWDETLWVSLQVHCRANLSHSPLSLVRQGLVRAKYNLKNQTAGRCGLTQRCTVR